MESQIKEFPRIWGKSPTWKRKAKTNQWTVKGSDLKESEVMGKI